MFEKYRAEIFAAAAAALPNEMCGVIVGGEFIVLDNVAEDPENHFMFGSSDISTYMTHPKLEAIVHSHPPARYVDEETGEVSYAPRLGPSAKDMQQQKATNVPWVIAALDHQSGQWHLIDWGDHSIDVPYLGRPFYHATDDCYMMVRRYFWQEHAIKLREYPRDDQWWNADEDLYVKNFMAEGFKQIDPPTLRDLQVGDAFLFKLLSRKYNHAGVYIGRGLLAHHAPGRQSVTTPVGPWFRRIDCWLRRPL